MLVYQVINDADPGDVVYVTKEAAALKLFDIVIRAKEGSTLNDLLRVYKMEVK